MRPPSVIRKLSKRRQSVKPRYCWATADENYFQAIREVARCELLALTGPAPRLRRNHRPPSSRDPNSWPNACLALGLTTAYRLFHRPEDLDAVARYVNVLIDSEGGWRQPLRQVDQCMIGTSLIDLFEWSSEQRYRRATDALVQFLLEEHSKTPSGTLPYTARVPSLVLVDTLAMVCPVLAAYGNQFDVPEATDLAVVQLDEFLQHGLSVKSGLPFHGFQLGGPEELGVVGWARGTGWLAVGLVDTLARLPGEHEARPRLCAALRALAEAVKPFQTDDGAWRWAVTVPEGPIDTSGTGMIGYCIERAVALGVLEADWTDVSERALAAIVRSTRHDGLVDRANGECLGIGLHPANSGPAPWAQGPAVALAALVLDRQRA